MEAVQYEHAITDDNVRRTRLRRACMAFLAEPSTRRDIVCISLMVDVPTLSRTAIAPNNNNNTLSSSVPPSKSAADGSKAQRITAKLKQRKQLKDLAAQRCSAAAEGRLHTAFNDAKALETWINHYYYNSSNSNAKTNNDDTKKTKGGKKQKKSSSAADAVVVSVVVMARLSPRSLADFTLYTQWQRGLEAQRYSPLRFAALVSLSVGAETDFIADWMSHTAATLDCGALLQPHQTLLLDLSWCVDGVMRRRRALHSDTKAALQPEAMLRLFTDELQQKIQLTKDSRVGVLITYVSYLHYCCADEHRDDSGRDPYYNFSVLCHGMCALQHKLHTAPAAIGRVKSWKTLTCYGGTVESLITREACVAVEAPGPRRPPAEENPLDEVGLLPCRAQQDIYALLGLLTAPKVRPLFSDAVNFCRRVQKRLQAAQFLGMYNTTAHVPPTQVPTVTTEVEPSAALSAEEIFFSQGAKAIMARERKLRAKRPRSGEKAPVALKPRAKRERSGHDAAGSSSADADAGPLEWLEDV